MAISDSGCKGSDSVSGLTSDGYQRDPRTHLPVERAEPDLAAPLLRVSNSRRPLAGFDVKL